MAPPTTRHEVAREGPASGPSGAPRALLGSDSSRTRHGAAELSIKFSAGGRIGREQDGSRRRQATPDMTTPRDVGGTSDVGGASRDET
jgi:hypothetical protein